MSMRYCAIRSRQRKFGIAFTVPDRVTIEINDKRRIMGKHPLRITRIPSGGPSEFHKFMQEAEKGSSLLNLLKKKSGVTKKLLIITKGLTIEASSMIGMWKCSIFRVLAIANTLNLTLTTTYLDSLTLTYLSA